MVFLSSYKSLFEGKFKIFYNEEEIIVLEKGHSIYPSDNEVVFRMNAQKPAKNKVLEILSKQETLPEELERFLKERTEGILGRRIELFTDSNDPTRYCAREDFAHYYGIENPIRTTLEVLETFDNQKDFDASFDENEKDIAFGFWDIAENSIDDSFVFPHPVQTKLCFGDFGNSDLSKGSLFVKMKRTTKA